MILYVVPGVIITTGLIGGVAYHLVRNRNYKTIILSLTLLVIYSLWVGELYLCSIQIGK